MEASSTNSSSKNAEEGSSTTSKNGEGSSTSSTNTICTSSGTLGDDAAATAGDNNTSSPSSAVNSGDNHELKSSKEATPDKELNALSDLSSEKDAKDAKESSTLTDSSTNDTTQTQNDTGSAADTDANTTSCSNKSSKIKARTTTSSPATQAAPPSSTGNAVGSSNSSSETDGTAGTSSESLSASGVTAANDEPMPDKSPASADSATSSTSTKRTFESKFDQGEDQDEEEMRKRKKKDNIESIGSSEVVASKDEAGSKQSASMNNPGKTDECADKSGQQAAGAMSAKSTGQSDVSSNAERKSPSSCSLSDDTSSPESLNPSRSISTINIPKGSTESDGEDEGSKNTDCSTTPKVPPLKIVISQSATSEQEQSKKNMRNTLTRGHQLLPYIVASSNSNDSMDKDSGMTAVTDGAINSSSIDSSGVPSKSDDRKDFGGALDNAESRSTHRQRILRSSHRAGYGSNAANAGLRESSRNTSSHGNASPLPAANATDQSNNSSPQHSHYSPTSESSGVSEKSASTDSTIQNNATVKSSNSSEKSEKLLDVKKEAVDWSESNVKKESTDSEMSNNFERLVGLHPRKRRIKPYKEANQPAAATNEIAETSSTGQEIHSHGPPITNYYEQFLNLRKQINERRKALVPVQFKPPQGFKDYLMNRCTYALAGNANEEPSINLPTNLISAMKDFYVEQEQERHKLRMQHVVEKEKLVLSVEQEILRVHGRAARAAANQSLPFSVCTILQDEEVYNMITPEQEEKDRNSRSRHNGRLVYGWLQDVDDKWDKIKEDMLKRHTNEAQSLHAVQRMNWEWKLKELGHCNFSATPVIEDLHVPIVEVSDVFDLLS